MTNSKTLREGAKEERGRRRDTEKLRKLYREAEQAGWQMVPGWETEQMFASSCELMRQTLLTQACGAGAPTCSVPILLQVAWAINGGRVSRGPVWTLPGRPPSRQCDLGPQCSHLGNGPQGPCQAHQTLSHQSLSIHPAPVLQRSHSAEPQPPHPGSWLPLGNVANLAPPTQGLIFLPKVGPKAAYSISVPRGPSCSPFLPALGRRGESCD